MDYRCFLISMANLVTENKRQKAEYAFKLFDMDNSGSIDREELIKILMATHMSTDPSQVESKVDAIMRQGDTDGSGELEVDDFHQVAERFPNIIFPKYNHVAKI